MNIYFTFLSCLTVSTITRILDFFKSTFIVWNCPLRFSRVFLHSLLLNCKKTMRNIFSNTVKRLSSIQNTAQRWYCPWSTHLSWSEESKEFSWARSWFCFSPHFSNGYFLKKTTQPKSLTLTCISLLLTTMLYSQHFIAKWDDTVFNLIQNSRWCLLMDYFVSDYDIDAIFLLPHYPQKGWYCWSWGIVF